MDIYDVLEDYLSQGKCGVLATIVNKTGATPQGVGARMFIGEEGKIFGTVGGGCVEAEIWQVSRKSLQAKEAGIFCYALDGMGIEDDGMICGGTVHIFLEPIFEKYRDLYKKMGYFQKSGIRAVTVTCFGAGSFSKTIFTMAGEIVGDPESDTAGIDKNLFYKTKPMVFEGKIVEPVVVTSNLYIYGAGHISQFISKLAKTMDFNVSVMDDRVQFASRERFLEADEIIVDEFENIQQYIDNNKESYAVIVTRGHKNDALVLEKVLEKQHKYVGMIGSKRKVRIIFDYLKKAGIGREVLNNVRAPIGIDINAVTPQEIALSIVAEIVKVRGKNTFRSAA